MSSQHIVQARSHHVLYLVVLLVLLKLSQLDETHVDRLGIKDVPHSHSKDEVKSLNVFLAVKEDLPDLFVQEQPLQYIDQVLHQLVVFVQLLNFEDVENVDFAVSSNLDQVDVAVLPQSAFKIYSNCFDVFHVLEADIEG